MEEIKKNLKELLKKSKERSRTPFNYSKDLPTEAAINYKHILELNNETATLVSQLESKINTTLAKEEAELITLYNKKLQFIQFDLTTMRMKYEELKKEMSRDDKGKQIMELKNKIKSQWEEIQRLLVECKKKDKKIMAANETIKQMQSDCLTLEKRIKHHIAENNKFQIEILKLKKIQNQDKVEISEETERYKESKSFEKLNVTKSFSLKDNENNFSTEEKQESNEVRCEDTVKALKRQLTIERSIVRNLRKQQTHTVSTHSELENLFIDCVNEVRCTSGYTNEIGTDTSKSRIKIMKLFMSNEKLLKALYKLVFNKVLNEDQSVFPSLAPNFDVSSTRRRNHKLTSVRRTDYDNFVENFPEINVNQLHNDATLKAEHRNYKSDLSKLSVIRKGRLLVSKRISRRGESTEHTSLIRSSIESTS